jgi:archaellum component FlaC
MQKSLDNQSSWIATIRSDLEDIRSRLAVVETTMEMVAKEGENNTTKGNATRRTLWSQQ